MLLLENDTFGENSVILYLFMVISLAGIYDITSEIMDDHLDWFSKNSVKKLMVFSVVYLKTKSIYISSLISICLFLAFPRVFFGKPTHPKLKNKS